MGPVQVNYDVEINQPPLDGVDAIAPPDKELGFTFFFSRHCVKKLTSFNSFLKSKRYVLLATFYRQES